MNISKPTVFLQTSSAVLNVSYFSHSTSPVFFSFASLSHLYPPLPRIISLFSLSSKRFSSSRSVNLVSNLFSEFQILILGIISLLFKRHCIFTSFFNNRPLFLLSCLPFLKIHIFDFQSLYLYQYLQNYPVKSPFIYGSYRYHFISISPSLICFPESSPIVLLSSLISHSSDGSFLIIDSPTRLPCHLVDLLSYSCSVNHPILFLTHPKSSRLYIDHVKAEFLSSCTSSILFTSIDEVVNSQTHIDLAHVLSFGSTMDFLFFAHGIPVSTPISFSSYPDNSIQKLLPTTSS